MNNKPVKKMYDEYYQCGYCESVYHVSMLDKPELSCKDCGNNSTIPKEVQEKSKPHKK